MEEEIDYEAEAKEILNKAIQLVAFKYNAYVPIISSLQTTYTETIPTMGVDRFCRMAVNPKFLVKNKGYAEGMLIHEVLHIFMGHTGEMRDKLKYTEDTDRNRLINIAEDCAINQFIKEALPESAIKVPLLRKALKNDEIDYLESSEYYFDKIMEYKQNNPNGSGGENGEDLEYIIKNNPDKTGDLNGQTLQDILDQMGVKHISGEEINDKAMDVAKQIAKSQGHQYGSLADYARQVLEPKVDWRPLLQATIRNAEKKVWNMKLRNTYKRTSKRSKDVLLPKKYGNKIAVTLSFDTSGSISKEMVDQFLSEIQSCMRLSELKECSLWHTDNYWYGTPQELEQKVEKVFECGGTDEACMGRAEKHCRADLHIHFSDGYHGTNFGFEHPEKNIEIVWDGNDIKDIKKF